MSTVKLRAFSAALVELLRSDIDVRTAFGSAATQAPIYTHVPEKTPRPYCRITTAARNWDTKTAAGFEVRVTLHIISDARSEGQVLGMVDAFHAALSNQDVALDVGQVVNVIYDSSDSFIEPDGLTHHGVESFLALLSE